MQAEASLPPTQSSAHISFRDYWDNRRVLMFCFIIYLLPVNFGYEVSMMGKLLAVTPFAKQFGYQVEEQWVVRATDQQILNAANTIGIFVSAFTTGIVSDWIGRKKTIGVACVVCIGGIIMQYFSTSIPMIFGGKLISTLGFGLGHSLGPVFVAELAPVKMRGLCLVLINTMIVLGQWLNSLVIYACNTRYFNDLAWRIPIITQLIPPGLLVLVLFFLPESPTWLLINGRREDAAKAFRRFNGAGFDVDAALAVADIAIAKEREARLLEKSSRWLDCFRGTNLRRTTIIAMVYLSQQFIGVNFISGYLTYYFRLAGVHNPLAIGQAANAIQLFGNICSWPLVDRLGRRPMIVGGAFVMTALLLVIGGISTINSSPALSATVAFMVIWGFLYQATLGACAYSVGGETASMELRQKTYSINIMSSTAVSCLISQVMPYLLNTDKANLGGKISFVFFATSLPMCTYLYFCLPELKGRNYAEVQEMFETKVPTRQFKKHVTVVEQAAAPTKGMADA
ncbi:general substrate transporter [Sarocladium strictum]